MDLTSVVHLLIMHDSQSECWIPMPRKPGPRPVERPESKVFTFILPLALIEQIDAIATEERRSRVKTVEIALEDFVRQYRAQAAA